MLLLQLRFINNSSRNYAVSWLLLQIIPLLAWNKFPQFPPFFFIGYFKHVFEWWIIITQSKIEEPYLKKFNCLTKSDKSKTQKCRKRQKPLNFFFKHWVKIKKSKKKKFYKKKFYIKSFISPTSLAKQIVHVSL